MGEKPRCWFVLLPGVRTGERSISCWSASRVVIWLKHSLPPPLGASSALHVVSQSLPCNHCCWWDGRGNRSSGAGQLIRTPYGLLLSHGPHFQMSLLVLFFPAHLLKIGIFQCSLHIPDSHFHCLHTVPTQSNSQCSLNDLLIGKSKGRFQPHPPSWRR